MVLFATSAAGIALAYTLLLVFFGSFVWAGREVVRRSAGDRRKAALGLAVVACVLVLALMAGNASDGP